MQRLGYRNSDRRGCIVVIEFTISLSPRVRDAPGVGSVPRWVTGPEQVVTVDHYSPGLS